MLIELYSVTVRIEQFRPCIVDTSGVVADLRVAANHNAVGVVIVEECPGFTHAIALAQEVVSQEVEAQT